MSKKSDKSKSTEVVESVGKFTIHTAVELFRVGQRDVRHVVKKFSGLTLTEEEWIGKFTGESVSFKPIIR